MSYESLDNRLQQIRQIGKMQVYNRYIFRTTLIATVFISLILVAVTMLTQSLRFLELIVDSGASTWSFWLLTFLNLPKFFEIIIPIGLATSIIFILNKMILDSEISVLKATGFSHWSLARPMVVLGFLCSLFLLLMTTWLGPISIGKTNILKQVLKSELTGLIFKDGVFNDVGNGLTFYIRELDSSGELHGLIIHDSRVKGEPAVTIHAKRGVLVTSDTGDKIIVFDGARQDYNPKNKTLQRLSFDRYTIDLPKEKEASKERTRKPKERTLVELINPKSDPDLNKHLTDEQRHTFFAEANLRILGPFLALTYVFIALTALLCGPINRRGQSHKIILAIGLIVLIQSLYIALSEIATKSDGALVATYLLVFLPMAICFYILTSKTRTIKRKEKI